MSTTTRPLTNDVTHATLPSRDALYVSTTEKTFERDEYLPNLPVPPLDQTLKKYLESVKAFVTDDEYKATEAIVKEFQSGIGKDLHQKLMEKAKFQKNWLEKWWEELAYLTQRTPLLPLCSMVGFCNMEDTWPLVSGTQIEHAALYLHYQLQFWKLLRKEQLRPHFSSNSPWSMHQFRRFFSTARIPGETIDHLECHFHTESEDPSTPTHVIIIYAGHIFTFDAVDEYGDILTPPEISLQLQRLVEWCEMNGQGLGIGSLTVDDRTTWAKNRELLLQIHPENRLHMDTISTALVVLVLDDAEPKDLTAISRETLAGNCCNRWADKSVADVMYKNGTFAMISDHTPFDGLVPVVVGHYAFVSIKETGGKWNGPSTVDRDLLPPRRLDFHVDNHIVSSIKEAQKNYQQMVDDVDVTCRTFVQYGKAFLKPHNIHPESYAQLALQLAYYTMHGRPAPTYVTAATRQFYHGRTETLRSCTTEVMDWVHSMVEDTASSRDKLQYLHIAVSKFKNMMKDCTKNHGCDRHLLGLYMISVEEGLPVPDIFIDPSWIKSGGSGNFVLSTSCCGYTPISGCVMPMKENGYGTFYNIENNRFTFTITSFNKCSETNAEKFFQHIERALLSMEHLLTSARL